MTEPQQQSDDDGADREWVVPATFGFVFGVLSATMGGGWVNTFLLVLIVVSLSWWLTAAQRRGSRRE